VTEHLDTWTWLGRSKGSTKTETIRAITYVEALAKAETRLGAGAEVRVLREDELAKMRGAG